MILHNYRLRPEEIERIHMVMASRSNGNYADDEDDIFTRGEYKRKDRRVKVDLVNRVDHSSEQKASTPRSKHSATEQRRRTKINERFQTLIDLMPPRDQKRDKASLLLEVIEYIRLLQDKVQKYESLPSPTRILEGAKLSPWRANQGYWMAAGVPLSCGSANAGPAETSEMNPSSAHDNFIHDEGTSDLSSTFSQRLSERLTGSMERAGVDLTSVNISVKLQVERQIVEESLKDDAFLARVEKRPKLDSR